MAAYTSTQSGNFNDAATWGGGGWPNADADTFTVVAGHTVTYNVTTPLNTGLGSSVVNAGGTFILDNNTRIRFDGASTFVMAISGNFTCRSNVEIYLKGTTAADKIFDIRSYTQLTTTANAGVSGQNTVTVSNSTGIIVGNRISGTGIGTAATVTQINGNILTISTNNTSTVSGTITVGNKVEMIGSEGMPTSNITSAITVSEYQQGFINVANASAFVANDWISAYERGYTDALIDRNDEGFIVHEVSANTIYLREFVGPTTTITSASANTITVANAKKFRTYQKLIFGTDANRNILSITNINNTTNVISLSANVSGNVTSQTVYTTGPFQFKAVNDKVRKVATTVATQAASNATQIILASVAGFNVDDEILIDSRWPNDSSYTDERPEKRNITAINGNTITLNASLGYIAYVGSFVVRLTRDIKVIGDYETTLTLNAAQSLTAGDEVTQAFSRAKGYVKTTTANTTTVVIQDIFGAFITGSTNNPWISVNGTPLSGNVFVSSQSLSTTQGHCQFALNRGSAMTTNHLGVLEMRDIEFTTFSNQNSTSSRLWLRGFWSSPNYNGNGGVEFEGLTWHTPSQTDNFNFSTRRFNLQRYLDNATLRCCVCYNSEGGFYADEGYNLTDIGMFNNYSARAENFLYIVQHIVGGAWEVAYNYGHRADDIGLLFNVPRYSGRGVHHNWINMAQGRAVQYDISYGQGILLFQNKFEGYFIPVLTFAGRSLLFNYNEFIPVANFFDFGIDTGFQNHNFGVLVDGYIYSLQHNYEADNTVIYIPSGQRVWDGAETAWRCTFDDDASVECGFDETIWIPADTAVTITGTIKLDPAFNGTAPKLELLDCNDRFYFGGSQSIMSANHPLVGSRVNANFNASILNRYQSVTITSDAKPFGRYATVGIICTNANASEGWWEKPVEVTYSSLPDIAQIQAGIMSRSISLSLSNDAYLNERKVRLGGRVT